MQHYRSLDDVHLQGAWVTIGSFDGVHRGHQAVLNRLVQSACAAQQPAVVVTFFPHPSVVLRGLQGPFYLTSPDERARLMAELGIDVVVTLPFDLQLASLSADDFMAEIADHLHLSHLVVGYDFALGRARSGNVHTLRHIGETYNYEVDAIASTDIQDQPVSSTRIRELINKGQVSDAALLLGRWYSVTGQVVHGDGRGGKIGIPTANLSVWSEQILPMRGVYATLAWVNNRPFPAVTNIGLRPTFETNPTLSKIETHLLDFNEDLYNMDLRLDFVKFLRPEQRFPSVQALIDQIQQDIISAREVLPYVS
jgi:riboflavin kinase / FMN adenylyltransferase